MRVTMAYTNMIQQILLFSSVVVTCHALNIRNIKKRDAKLFNGDYFVFNQGPFSSYFSSNNNPSLSPTTTPKPLSESSTTLSSSEAYDRSPSPTFLYDNPTTPTPIYISNQPQSYRSPRTTSFSLIEEPLPQNDHRARNAQLTPAGLPLEFNVPDAPATESFLKAAQPTPFTAFADGLSLAKHSAPVDLAPTASVVNPFTFGGQQRVIGFSGSLPVQKFIPQPESRTFHQQRPTGQLGIAPEQNLPRQPRLLFGSGFGQFDSLNTFNQFAIENPQNLEQSQFTNQQPNFIPEESLFQQPQQPQQFNSQLQIQQQAFQQFEPQSLQQIGSEAPSFKQQDSLQQQNLEPQVNIEQQETLFNTINKLAIDREPRRKLKDPSKMKHMSKHDALARLMNIAGDDWDLNLSIEKNLLSGQSEKIDYNCPTPAGHFPDKKKCNVYYQCSNGIPTKQSCQSGLNYNVLTNQCDWEANVDCNLNKDPRMATQNAGPISIPQTQTFQPPFIAEQTLPFSTFFKF